MQQASSMSHNIVVGFNYYAGNYNYSYNGNYGYYGYNIDYGHFNTGSEPVGGAVDGDDT